MVHTAENFYQKQITSWFGEQNNIIRGLVPGARIVEIFAEDLGAGPGLFKIMGGLSTAAARATSVESWEVVSTSAQDSPTGDGCGTIQIPLLDENFVETLTTVEMDGTTPVDLGPDNFRVNSFRGLLPGSTAIPPFSNFGDITVQTTGGATIRAFMREGQNFSRDGIYTVPAGKRAIPQFFLPNVSKNLDVEILMTASDGSNPVFNEFAEVSVYQNGLPVPITVAKPFVEGTDIAILVTATNPVTRSTVKLVLIEEDV